MTFIFIHVKILCFVSFSNLANVGTIISAYPPELIQTTVGTIYNICNITITEGTWLLIGYTLAVGNLIIEGKGLFASRKSSNNEDTHMCFGIAKVSSQYNIVLKLVADYSSSIIHADGNYCGLRAIRLN